MRILIVSATKEEIAPLLKNRNFFKNNIEVLITGPGMISTVYHLTKKIEKQKFDLIINAGIAGSFSKKVSLGNIVNVTDECFSELGAEDGVEFIHISKMKFDGSDNFPLRRKFLINKTKIKSKTVAQLQKVKGITVNTVHGNNSSIKKVKKLFNPEIETMEGAAFFYVCEKEKIPFVQIRAISNYVEKRDKSKWEIKEAINNLCETLQSFLEELR